MRRLLPACAALIALAAGLSLGARLLRSDEPRVMLAGYATPLTGRTVTQRYNARLSAQALDGAVIPAGGVFSYNQTVKPWTVDQGYLKAPVSYDGEIVRAYGGGVCQTSTTLYNAALLAGLDVLERHPHVYAPRYVPPGRDAAVAQYTVDLRIRNPYPWPLRIAARTTGERVEIRIYGAARLGEGIEIVTEVLAATPPARVTRVLQDASGEIGSGRSAGATGYRVVTSRVFSRMGQEVRRERLSDDSYPAADRVIALIEDSRP
ncbi:MAG TPA: VanW family protein [bacterium]|nr:VanW family protein [bacterium]